MKSESFAQPLTLFFSQFNGGVKVFKDFMNCFITVQAEQRISLVYNLENIKERMYSLYHKFFEVFPCCIVVKRTPCFVNFSCAFSFFSILLYSTTCLQTAHSFFSVFYLRFSIFYALFGDKSFPVH